MKGIFNLKPPQPRYSKIWDFKVVLNYLRQLSPAESLGLRDLTHKLCMLIALTSTQRLETLHKQNTADLEIMPDLSCFHIKGLVKQSRPGNVGTVVKLSGYPPHRRLCVFHYLQYYLQKTSTLRAPDNKQLFISFRRPHDGVSKDTIARWIRVTLNKAGIDTDIYRPHSTRAASTSALDNASIPVSDIVNAAGWARRDTFRRFYNKPIDQGQKSVGNSFGYCDKC